MTSGSPLKIKHGSYCINMSWMSLKATFQHDQESLVNSVLSPQERNTFNYSPLSKMRQNLPTTIHLPLCIVLSLSPDPLLCPLPCLMLCQHHLSLWSRQAQKWTFLLYCRWLMWLRQPQSIFTYFPATPVASPPTCLLYDTISHSLPKPHSYQPNRKLSSWFSRKTGERYCSTYQHL